MKRVTFRSLIVFTFAVSLSVFIAGCSQKKVEKPDEAMESVVVESPETGMVESGRTDETAIQSEGLGEEESLASQPVEETMSAVILEGRSSAPLLPVYFDFDQSVVREDMRERVEMAAAFLKDNPSTQVRVEGNCDERGTNEYNMALGERRGQSAKKYLMLLGIDESRMNTISYGEERPLNYGHDELSWSQNRRDDFVIVK